jgi:hypothetical protein
MTSSCSWPVKPCVVVASAVPAPLQLLAALVMLVIDSVLAQAGR